MKKYTELPIEQKNLVENYFIGDDAAQQCEDTLMMLFKSKDAVVDALVCAYGDWYHRSRSALEALQAAGFTKDEIETLADQYYTYHHPE